MGCPLFFCCKSFRALASPESLTEENYSARRSPPFGVVYWSSAFWTLAVSCATKRSNGSLVGVGKLQIGGKKLLAVQTKTILTGQLSHQIGRMLGEHFAAAMPQPFLIDIEFPADRTQKRFGETTVALFDFGNGGTADADPFAQFALCQTEGFSQVTQSFVHDYHLLAPLKGGVIYASLPKPDAVLFL